MATAKLVLIYPRPQDEQAFEQVYRDVHMPMAEQKLERVNRFSAVRIMESPQGRTRTYRIFEAHFSTLDDLRKCIESDGARELLDHAKSISTGGPPIILICEEESHLVW